MKSKLVKFVEQMTAIIDNEVIEAAKLGTSLTSSSFKELEDAGYALSNLINDTSAPAANNKSRLPDNMLAAGSTVELLRGYQTQFLHGYKARFLEVLAKNYETLSRGTVKSITTTSVVVVFGKGMLLPQLTTCSIRVTPSTIMFDRMRSALIDMPRTSLCGVLFGGRPPRFDWSATIGEGKILNETLNESQRAAVNLALAAKDIAVIHGPPGTGKTRVLVEAIRQLVASKKRVLACGPSNTSVDCIAGGLIDAGEKRILRFGSPAMICAKVLPYSYEERHRPAITKETIVLSTLSGAGSRELQCESFDVAVIDESTQSLEVECWIAAVKADKVVLAGDPHQLPPVLVSPANEKYTRCTTTAGGSGTGVGVTMFERAQEAVGGQAVHMLNVQYRMNTKIMIPSSKALYGDRLVADDSVAAHLLCDLPDVSRTPDTTAPLVFIDTSGADMAESLWSVRASKPKGQGRAIGESKSKLNKGEATVVVAHIERLIQAGVRGKDIGVISPYKGQTRYLQQVCRPFLVEVQSVDGFQGGEKEAIILSLVRSNMDRGIGFLRDYRRINVAITRARRHLCVVGDSWTLSSGRSFVGAVVEYLKEKADVRAP
ncbi:DNA-binding protein SMUBP-2 [Coemansia javaensis]|uniref:DNA-binding protein SMUBP-2 n=1 Tax=Coemansia javaensis TaxID=2761396 RepID=A0A9W8HGQ1_9FUNG|nr:DNA-binding protein SMUBP-2 [Coemansia javaensis]